MPTAGQRPGPAAARGGRDRRRQDQHARDGHPARDRARALRPGPQPVGHDAHDRRLLGRERRRGGLRHGPGRPRERRRRLDPHPGLVLRPRRPQAEPRSRVARARSSASSPAPSRSRDASAATSPTPRSILDVISGYEPGRPVLGPRPLRARSPRRSDATPGTLRDRLSPLSPRTARRCTTTASRRSTQTAELLESLGHSVDEAPPFADEGYVENFIKVWTAGVADEVHTYGRLRGAPLDLDKLEPLTRQMVDARGRRSSADGLPGRARLPAPAWHASSSPSWSDIDVLLTPTVCAARRCRSAGSRRRRASPRSSGC